MSIYAECAGITLNEVAERYEGKMYGPFKKSWPKWLSLLLNHYRNDIAKFVNLANWPRFWRLQHVVLKPSLPKRFMM